MKTKWTPGPWKAHRLEADGFVIHGGKEGWEISTLEYDVAANIQHGAPIRNEHDAKLIAKAPTMIEYIIRKADDGDLEAKAIMDRMNEQEIRAKLEVLGWVAEKRSFYDEEGVEGWAWVDPSGDEQYWEIGDWGEPAPIPEALMARIGAIE